jgi:hypothetical protein
MDDEPTSEHPDSIARFELDLADGYIGDIWRAVFGPDEPQPKRTQALSRLLGVCLQTRWTWREPPPRSENLPIGLVLVPPEG